MAAAFTLIFLVFLADSLEMEHTFENEDILYIPTPKTPRRQTTRDDRLRIETLYFDAGFTQD